MPGVAGGQDRRLLEVAQCLVAPGRVGVMVGVPLQVVQGHIGRDVVGVPAVAGVDTLVAFLAGCANLLAVMSRDVGQPGDGCLLPDC